MAEGDPRGGARPSRRAAPGDRQRLRGPRPRAPAPGGGRLVPVGGRRPSADGTVAVVGPGTGLGVAGLVPPPSGWVPLPGEGGQVDVPAATDRELEVARLLRAEHGSATAELLLSGGGLSRLHRYRRCSTGRRPSRSPPRRSASAPASRAAARPCSMFCALLGSLAGNVALTLGARGGVLLGGGILPRIADVLRDSEFRARFETKPPVEDYLRGIPTALIVHPGPALVGATLRLAQSLALGTCPHRTFPHRTFPHRARPRGPVPRRPRPPRTPWSRMIAEDLFDLAPVIPVVVVDDAADAVPLARALVGGRPPGDRGDAAHPRRAGGDRADRRRGAGRGRRRGHGRTARRRRTGGRGGRAVPGQPRLHGRAAVRDGGTGLPSCRASPRRPRPWRCWRRASRR